MSKGYDEQNARSQTKTTDHAPYSCLAMQFTDIPTTVATNAALILFTQVTTMCYPAPIYHYAARFLSHPFHTLMLVVLVPSDPKLCTAANMYFAKVSLSPPQHLKGRSSIRGCHPADGKLPDLSTTSETLESDGNLPILRFIDNE